MTEPLNGANLRVAVLCPGYGCVTRGVETFSAELVRRLACMHPGWRIDIFCRASSGPICPGVERIHVPAVDRDGRMASLYAKVGHRLGVFLRTRIDAECLSFALTLAPRLIRARYDVVFNQAGPFVGRLLQAKRRMDGTSFIHKTASGHSELELLMARQHPDAVVATSPFVRDWLAEHSPGVNIECIPNAVDRSEFRPYSAQELMTSRDGLPIFRLKRPVILFVGAMDPMKRPELLISAAARIPGVSLAMVGSGRLTDSIVRRGVETLGDRFLHVPRVSREQMAVCYNACDLFTIPSEEPFGIVFLEAMACNRPVLGHDSPVQEWLFGDAGATCDCTNVEGYAQAMHRMLATDFGTRPLERSRAFDWSEVTPRYADLLRQVAASRRRS